MYHEFNIELLSLSLMHYNEPVMPRDGPSRSISMLVASSTPPVTLWLQAIDPTIDLIQG